MKLFCFVTGIPIVLKDEICLPRPRSPVLTFSGVHDALHSSDSSKPLLIIDRNREVPRIDTMSSSSPSDRDKKNLEGIGLSLPVSLLPIAEHLFGPSAEEIDRRTQEHAIAGIALHSYLSSTASKACFDSQDHSRDHRFEDEKSPSKSASTEDLTLSSGDISSLSLAPSLSESSPTVSSREPSPHVKFAEHQTQTSPLHIAGPSEIVHADTTAFCQDLVFSCLESVAVQSATTSNVLSPMPALPPDVTEIQSSATLSPASTSSPVSYSSTSSRSQHTDNEAQITRPISPDSIIPPPSITVALTLFLSFYSIFNSKVVEMLQSSRLHRGVCRREKG